MLDVITRAKSDWPSSAGNNAMNRIYLSWHARDSKTIGRRDPRSRRREERLLQFRVTNHLLNPDRRCDEVLGGVYESVTF
jgi:hypothetical protein